ncbi:hypothetical protein DENIS_0722 [Desulfonema ishimotonii]|uniref:Cytochrome c domain-containing protein n=1 Tax=Desulfonema ishimotonii TaxID=45657 RepID=A0A401FS30_9BACT|nr:c-type cytochrome [Desulfonema ishimotonii]GBC59781.1 hypothetical protein DENIS_0722 [Desulfonema ishimotonii]
MKARALFLLIFALFLTACNDWRMWETPAVRPHEEELLVMPEGTVPVSGGEAFHRLADAGSLLSPLAMNDPAVVRAGETGYGYYCIQCHGKYLDGNGTVGQSFQPLPTDLRSQGVQAQANGMLFKTVSYGIPDKRQPALATTVSVEERWQIIAYIRSQGRR